MSVTLTPRALPSLTGLRWCAALAVWAYHLRNVGFFSGRSEELLSRVVGGGDTGVSLFFVLSGFVLAWSHRDETSPQRFWWARIARIAPLHLTALALAVAVVAPVVPEIVSPSRGSVVANALLISAWRPDWWQAGNPVSWSLVCEAAFYATFPLLTLVLRRVSTTALAVVAVAAVVATFAEPLLGLHAVQAVLPIPVDAGHSPIARFPEFLLGVAVARLMRTGAWRGAPLALAVPLAAVGYAAATAESSSPWHLSGFTVVGYGLLVTALARIDLSGRRSPLASAPMRWFGELSFAFYLVHLLVLQRLPTVLPVDPRGRAAVLHALLALVVATALAAGLHHGVELPARAVLLGRHQRRSAPYRWPTVRPEPRRADPGRPLEEPAEVRRFGETETLRDPRDREVGVPEQALRLERDPPVDQLLRTRAVPLGHGAGDRPDAVPEDLCVLGDGVQLGEPPLHLLAEPGRERVLHPVVGGRCRAALEQDEDRTEQQLQHHPGRDRAVVLARELAGDRTDRGGGFRVRDGHRLAHADPVGGRQARQELVGDEQVESVEVAVLEPLHLPRSHPQHPVTIERKVLEVDLSPAGALGDDREDVEVDPVLPSVGAEAHATPQVADPDDLDARHDGRPERQLLHLPHTDHLSRIDPNESTSALDAGTR